jgi:hypothetical protein
MALVLLLRESDDPGVLIRSLASVELFSPGRPPFRTLHEFMHAAVIPPDRDAPSTEEGAP